MSWADWTIELNFSLEKIEIKRRNQPKILEKKGWILGITIDDKCQLSIRIFFVHSDLQEY